MLFTNSICLVLKPGAISSVGIYLIYNTVSAFLRIIRQMVIVCLKKVT